MGQAFLLRASYHTGNCSYPGGLELCPRSGESLLPAHLGRLEARTVKVPDGIVAEKLAAGAAEHGPVSLPPDLIRRRIVLALVSGFQQNKRASRLAHVFRQHGTKQRFFTTVEVIDGQPRLFAKCRHRRAGSLAGAPFGKAEPFHKSGGRAAGHPSPQRCRTWTSQGKPYPWDCRGTACRPLTAVMLAV